ncbi:MAG: hypothetical protein A3G75_03030 [Verrucomicrobia bacterium RIFCSPLOWO2_12_FULL_64_8]|nr:MAG: hypothetical protein A3G75_03030 [Verrucomicrobia bacterium RIFCSPLOWO2_12_FULL_64_8]
MLLLANAFWGLSFPLIKALAYEHQRLLPGSGSWYVTCGLLAPRFVLASALLALWLRGAWRKLTRSEFRQGAGLALFAAAGMLCQSDGLQYTSASTSAFLTQLYVILIPLWVAWRTRRAPPAVVWVACGLVLAGVAVLGRVDWRELRLGRGEVETLVSAFFFMGQILLLDHRGFAGNRPLHVTLVMFVVGALIFVPLVLALAPQPADLAALAASAPWWGFSAGLTLLCTIGSFVIMNTWQPRITATEAGLIYCTEPVFAALLALFLPAWFSSWAGFDYPNETVTLNLLLGGGLVTAANVIIQWEPPPP